MVRTKEGGSVLGFVIISVVLMALFLGGVYFVRQQMIKPTETTPTPTPVEQPPAPEQPTELPGSTPAPEVPQSTTPTPSTQPHGALPQSGPGELLSSVMIVGILTLVVSAYLRSRRLAPSL